MRQMWHEYPELKDRANLYTMLEIEEMTPSEIAERVGCTPVQVASAINCHGLVCRRNRR